MKAKNLSEEDYENEKIKTDVSQIAGLWSKYDKDELSAYLKEIRGEREK